MGNDFIFANPLDLALFVIGALLTYQLLNLRKMDKAIDRLSQYTLKPRMRLCLRELREKKGISQTELSEKSGVPQSHISEMEAGRTVPTVFVAKRLARALGVSVEELIVEEN